MTPTRFVETPDEFVFWDRYFRLADGDEEKPYFNPVTLKRAERGFPHSNAATVRKNTFDLKWHAATRSQGADGADVWTLAGDYADIVRKKMLQKAGEFTRVPVVDLTSILFRNQEFPDGSGASDLKEMFRTRFPMAEPDYQKVFEFRNEQATNIFGDEAAPDYDSAIKEALNGAITSIVSSGGSETPPTKIEMEDDPVLLEVQDILSMGTSGIILKGPPGTGKTYYAQRIAKTLVLDPKTDSFRVQFHPSYGYEDFVEGYRPDDKTPSGFQIVDKIFKVACERARAIKPARVVMIIDEINRGDPARVFGELLTYLESAYREEEFILPFSGRSFSIPQNLLIIGTMNPNDRSVSFVDAAFVRRFDHIELQPSREVVEQMLARWDSFSASQITIIGEWFEEAQRMIQFGLGHSFFNKVTDVDSLKLVWRYRIRPTAETALEINDGLRENFFDSYAALIRRLDGVIGDP